MWDGGREGTGAKPCTSLREVPTRALKALPNTLLATRGDPKVMHRMSASGYSSADHAAPEPSKAAVFVPSQRVSCLVSVAQHTSCSLARHSTARHGTAQHSTAQHSTAQHSTAQHGPQGSQG